MITTGSPDTLDPWDAISAEAQVKPGVQVKPAGRRRLAKAGKGSHKALAAAVAAVLACGISTGAAGLCLGLARQDAAGALQEAVISAQPQVDLAPDLVTALLNDAPLERDTIYEVVQARNRVIVNDPGTDGSGETFARYAEAENALSGSLAQLVAAAKAHPKLMASASFKGFVEKLNRMTPRITEANGAYNAAARQYNSFRESFPASLVAPLLGHGEAFGYLAEP